MFVRVGARDPATLPRARKCRATRDAKSALFRDLARRVTARRPWALRRPARATAALRWLKK